MRALLVVLVLAITAGTSWAHQTSMKYVDLAIADRTVTIRVTVAPSDLTAPLQLSPDARPTVRDALDAQAAVARYVAAWVALPACPTTTPADALADPDDKFVIVTWRATCAQPIEGALAVDFTRFFAVDAKHQALVTAHVDDLPPLDPAIARAAHPVITLAMAAPVPTIHTGMDAIYRDPARIAFVVALLLAVPVPRTSLEPGSSSNTVRRLADAARTAGALLAALALAQSLALALAALADLHLPAPVVAIATALAVTYLAIEACLRPGGRGRPALVAGFGVISGLDLAERARTVPFGAGAAIAQLSIALVALPLLYVVARELTATRYRRTAMPAVALVLAVLAWV